MIFLYRAIKHHHKILLGGRVTFAMTQEKSFFRWRKRTRSFTLCATETNKLTGTANIPSSNIRPLIKATMFRRCVFLVRTPPPAHIPSGLRNLNIVYLLSLVFIWDVDVFNKGNSSVKFDLLPLPASISSPFCNSIFRQSFCQSVCLFTDSGCATLYWIHKNLVEKIFVRNWLID